jgi:serine/threonine protein kinase
MAEVQLALQRGPAGFEKLVVVKLVHESLASQKTFVDMLLDEARVAALVKHPNVVDIYDLGQADGRYFIAMEYLEGEPLLAVLRAGREGKRLDPLSTGRLIADTAEGLDAAHELRSMAGERIELVHHDISLGNIVVLYNGQVKLVDFGVAKATMSAAAKAKVQGKFSYMAPEKLKGAPGDRRSDIFSLGCVMWEALTLRRLFRGGNDNETMKQVLEMAIQPPSKINGDVPPEYDSIVLRALERDPAKRQLTAKELAVDIEELLRKRGYGAKNDKIARYMQDTFKAHIDARKKLVQEVASKGAASVEVLDAAFSDPVLASGSPVTPVGGQDFSWKYRRVTPPQGVPVAVANAWADSSGKTEIGPPPDFSVVTEVSDPPEIERIDPIDEIVRPVPPTAATRTVGDGIKERLRAFWADPKKRIIAGVGGGLLLVVIALVIVVATRGGGSSDAGTQPGSGSVALGSSVEPPPPLGSDNPGAFTGSAVTPPPPPELGSAGSAAGSGSGSSEEIAIEPPPPTGSATTHHPGAGSGSAHHVAVVEKVDPEALYQKGLQAYLKGDAKGAIGFLVKAKAARPGHAPTWRVLGQAYEKLGEKGPAKAAYQHYLTAWPTASDADNIRSRLQNL